MNSHLDDLSTGLTRAMGRSFALITEKNWGNPKPMSDISRAISSRIHRPLTAIDRPSVSQAMQRYRTSRELGGPADIKYVCIGAVEEFFGWRLLEDAELLAKLLQQAQAAPGQWRLKYFACLLRGYWSFPRNQENTRSASQKGWITLREWLDEQQRDLGRSATYTPRWFKTLTRHSNLLTNQPCIRYGQELLAGVSSSLNEALTILAVPSDSWLREEAVYAQMQAGTNLHDEGFQSCIARLANVASGKTDFKLAKGISIRCLALLVTRYAACVNKPENIALRDAAIAFIGNPWLHRAAWDSCVVDQSGEPDDNAREMVNGWLKVRLIKDFFDLLSEDRSADSRRLNYWLGFEPAIQDMWFALGSDAMSDSRKDYAEFRQRANGRLLDLSGATPTANNAFLMRMGDFVIIEFGITGNACFAYRYNDLPLRIKKCLQNKTISAVDIAELKAVGYIARLLHQGSWEPKFDAAICPLVRFATSAGGGLGWSRAAVSAKKVQDLGRRAPTLVYVNPFRTYQHRRTFNRLDFDKFSFRYGLDVEDLSKKGGCLWVRTDASDVHVCASLQGWGFSYRHGKGWWKE
jgi:EH_Signature domain